MISTANRIFAIILRQFYVMRSSLPRIVATSMWPTLEMIIWGLLNIYLAQKVDTFTLTTLLGACLLLNVFVRSNIQTMWGFIEDVWGRNIGNILITPISSVELLAGYIVNGFLYMFMGLTIACLFAYMLFDYSIFRIGVSIIPYSINLMLFGWSIGILLICMILRFGASGEHFAWLFAFMLTPLVAVYYPVSVLPPFLQTISWCLPPTYVFESLRQTIQGQPFNADYFLRGLALNGVYLVACGWVFHYQLEKARIRGGLLSMSSE